MLLIRQGIKKKGFSLTPPSLVAPADSYAALSNFHAWYFLLTSHWEDSAIHHLSWLTSTRGSLFLHRTLLGLSLVILSLRQPSNAAKDVLSRELQQCGSLSDTRPQHAITLEMNQQVNSTFQSQSLPYWAASVAPVGLQTIPSLCCTSLLSCCRACQTYEFFSFTIVKLALHSSNPKL